MSLYSRLHPKAGHNLIDMSRDGADQLLNDGLMLLTALNHKDLSSVDALGRLTRSQHRALEELQRRYADQQCENERLKEQVDLLQRRLERSERRARKSPVVQPCDSSKKRSVPPSEETYLRKRLRSGPNEPTKARSSERDEATASRSSNDPLGLNDVPRVVDVPTFRHKRMEPLRATMRLNEESCDDAVYNKRHEKLERNERQLVRRDRIWQREEYYRQKLLKKNAHDSNTEDDQALKITAIHMCKKLPRDVIKRHCS
uniref:PEHE domain-containing protein n=1 Tax=Plectus sambesii TaxID=2011161 RepID=A0A914WQB1_9BILA